MVFCLIDLSAWRQASHWAPAQYKFILFIFKFILYVASIVWLDAMIWSQLALHSKQFMAGGLMVGSSPWSTYVSSVMKNVISTRMEPVLPSCHRTTLVFHCRSRFIRQLLRTLEWQPIPSYGICLFNSSVRCPNLHAWLHRLNTVTRV